MKVLRAGFSQKLDPTISKFVSSAKDDEALIEVDIKGSLAHAKMLHACGLIEKETLDEIIHGLGKVHEFYQNNGSVLEDELEDVHMNVETRLKEIIGGHADHLHTARSRNDQVALDLRLYVLSQANALIEAVSKLMQSIGNCAKKTRPGPHSGLHAYAKSPACPPLPFSSRILRDARKGHLSPGRDHQKSRRFSPWRLCSGGHFPAHRSQDDDEGARSGCHLQ